jgi:hypothetical protein
MAARSLRACILPFWTTPLVWIPGILPALLTGEFLDLECEISNFALQWVDTIVNAGVPIRSGHERPKASRVSPLVAGVDCILFSDALVTDGALVFAKACEQAVRPARRRAHVQAAADPSQTSLVRFQGSEPNTRFWLRYRSRSREKK